MENLDLQKIHNVHFIGIGGIGISAVARMFLAEGKKVSGQDMQDSDIIHDLKNAGADISIGQSFENIPKDVELIVYTIAIEYYDPELFEKIKNLRSFSYPEMLHVVTEGKYTIAISGTHGKTTTTGMIAEILRDNSFDPTVIIGSLLVGEKTNFIAGSSKYFIVEACEYRRSFLNINPTILVITNIEADHLDYYKDIEDIKNAFHELAMKVPADGFVICNLKDENIADVVENISAKVIDYSAFLDMKRKLKVPGIHNKKNSAAAEAVGKVLEISKEENMSTKQIGIDAALLKFPGTWRRFEYKGVTKKGVVVYDDYAHHPTEILAALEGARELFPTQKILVIFQPHLFSRTKSLFTEFGASFTDATEIIILPIYFAREIDDGTMSSELLAQEIQTHEKNAFAKSFEDAEIYAKENLKEGDVIITMGAGEAYKIGDSLLNTML